MSRQSEDFNEDVIDVGPSRVGNSVEALGPDTDPVPAGIQVADSTSDLGPTESIQGETPHSSDVVKAITSSSQDSIVSDHSNISGKMSES